MTYVCHSGGCPGADLVWENEGAKYGVTTIAYSFRNHVQEGKNPKILTVDELNEGWDNVLIADKTLNKNVKNVTSPYMRNLLCRNWFQVKNSEAIFAAGKMDSEKQVNGGTGWAVQMAIDNKKPVYVFCQTNKTWLYFDYEHKMFWPFHTIPTLTENFAGIGTRDLNAHGIAAIQEICKHNLCI